MEADEDGSVEAEVELLNSRRLKNAKIPDM
jgi:hypothetical protein